MPKFRLGDVGNTYNPCLNVIRDMGFSLSLELFERERFGRLAASHGGGRATRTFMRGSLRGPVARKNPAEWRRPLVEPLTLHLAAIVSSLPKQPRAIEDAVNLNRPGVGRDDVVAGRRPD